MKARIGRALRAVFSSVKRAARWLVATRVRTVLVASLAVLLIAAAVVGGILLFGKKKLDNPSSYTLIYSQDVSTEVFAELLALREDITEKVGVTLDFEDDFVMYGEEVPTDTPEILIGRTNRPESLSKDLGRDDYGIYFENGRLVISGGSDEAVIKAITLFREKYVKDGKVTYPRRARIERGTYPYRSATIDGVPVHRFTVIYDSKSESFAKALAEEIAKATGAVLPVKSSGTAVGTHEILVGRFASGERKNTGELAADGWRIAYADGRLSIVGGDEDGTYAALLSFLSRLAGEGKRLELSAAADGTASENHLYTLNLPNAFPDLSGRFSDNISFTTETVIDRFLATRGELPTEITVLERVEPSRYPLSERNEVYVSPSGSDEAEGTKDCPLATLGEALSRMENAKGGVIFMMEGTYSLTESAIITRKHSGLAQSPLFIKAYEDKEVVLTSNKQLDTSASKWHSVSTTLNNWSDRNVTYLSSRFKQAAQGKILYTTLAEQGWTEADIPAITKESGPPSMFVGGEEYTLARFPNDTDNPFDLLYFTNVYDMGRVTVRDGSDLYWTWIERCEQWGMDPMEERGWEIRVIDEAQHDKSHKGYEHYEYGEEITSWVNTGDIWFYGSTFEGWEFGYYNLALETTEGGTTQYWAHDKNGNRWTPGAGDPYLGTPKGAVSKNPLYGVNADAKPGYSLKSAQPNSWGCKQSWNGQAGRNTYYLFNAIEALDAPGEWFYDKTTGYIYLYPTEEGLGEGGTAPKSASISSAASFNLLTVSGAENVVVDGLTFDGSAASGLYIVSTKNAVVESCTFKNTKQYNLFINDSYNVATIYSDFSAAGENLMRIYNGNSNLTLTPTNTVVQNCVFHDPQPLHQVALQWEACRVIVSHNYFNCTTTVGDNSTECIFEYNRFEGGSKDVTDGGMIYASGSASRNNHYRYNLFHMFNATHQAVYNDTMAGGNYMYNNVISTLGAKSDHCKSWYSSTGWGNVCYGNIQIFRDPQEVKNAGSGAGAEGDVPELATGDRGDYLGESHLFYYYFGDEHAATSNRAYKPVDYDGNPQVNVLADGTLGNQPTLEQSLAGHWWQGFKRGDVSRYLDRADAEAWEERDPVFINMMHSIELVLEHYPESGQAPSDYHIKYFYMPWYLSGKSYTYEDFPAGVTITVPSYQYLEPAAGGKATVVTVGERSFETDGEPFTLKYEEIAAIERQLRSCAYSVVKNNIILGGTPIYDTEGGETVMTDEIDRDEIIWDAGDGNVGYTATTLAEHNFMSFLYGSLVPGARSYDYTIPESAWQAIAAVLNPDHTVEAEAMAELRFTSEVWKQAGVTYAFDYSAWYDDVYPQ